MKRSITILFALLTLITEVSCSTPKDQDNTKTNSKSEKKSNNTMKGKIISKTFTNKGGKEISTIQDLYFETNEETYFIKFMESNITYDDAKALIDQTIEIEGEIIEGLWDVPDDNPQYAQSRTGLYLIIYKVVN